MTVDALSWPPFSTALDVAVRVEIGRAGGESLPLDVALSAALMTQLVLEGRCAHTGLGDTIRFKH